MQTDYIDIGIIHYIDNVDEWNNIMNNGLKDYVLSMKANGTIRHIGISTHNPVIALLEVAQIAEKEGIAVIDKEAALKIAEIKRAKK